MDPILGGQVAAEVRSVEQPKAVRPAPFRYNRARAEIKKAQELLAQVKREARGLGSANLSLEDKAFLTEVETLRAEYRGVETTDARRAEVRSILRGYRDRIRTIKRSGWRVRPSAAAAILLPALKIQMRAMMWAWAVARATEVDSGLNQDPRLQFVPLLNGKWARLKLPEGDRILRYEGSAPSDNIDDFRSWCAWSSSKNEEGAMNRILSDLPGPINDNLADDFLHSWETVKPGEADGVAEA